MLGGALSVGADSSVLVVAVLGDACGSAAVGAGTADVRALAESVLTPSTEVHATSDQDAGRRRPLSGRAGVLQVTWRPMVAGGFRGLGLRSLGRMRMAHGTMGPRDAELDRGGHRLAPHAAAGLGRSPVRTAATIIVFLVAIVGSALLGLVPPFVDQGDPRHRHPGR